MKIWTPEYFFPLSALKLRREFSRNQKMEYRELIEYQEKKLKEIVNFAYSNVPYYKALFDSLGLKPNDINGIDDLNKIPFLTKEIVKNNFDKLHPKDVQKYQPLIRNTGGSTGKPLQIIHDKTMRVAELCALWRFWDNIGYKLGQRNVRILNYPFKNGKIFERNHILNSINISSYQISKETTPLILDKLASFRPIMLRSYPGSAYLLSKFIKDLGLEKKARNLDLKCIMVQSETLYDFQRELIEEVFSAKVFDLYGHFEHVAMITECEFQNKHIVLDYGILETVDADGNGVGIGKVGEIVATTLHNKGMPLIRYRTGDLAVISNKECSCGCRFPVVEKLIGRIDDIIITPDGKYLDSAGFNNAMKYSLGIEMTQLIQTDVNKIIVKILPNNMYNLEDEKRLISGLRERLGEKIEIDFEKVSSLSEFEASNYLINSNSSRKYRLVISKVSKGKFFNDYKTQ